MTPYSINYLYSSLYLNIFQCSQNYTPPVRILVWFLPVQYLHVKHLLLFYLDSRTAIKKLKFPIWFYTQRAWNALHWRELKACVYSYHKQSSKETCFLLYSSNHGWVLTMVCFTLQCLPLPLQTPTQRYLRGAYKCECRQGYEYPFNDLSWFFDGQMMEEEYNKMLRGEPNRCAFCYHILYRQDYNSFSHWFLGF